MERHTDVLEQGVASLVAQVGEVEYNMGILATVVGSKEKEKEPTDPLQLLMILSGPLHIFTMVHWELHSQASLTRIQMQSSRQRPLYHFAAVLYLKVIPQNRSFLALTP